MRLFTSLVPSNFLMEPMDNDLKKTILKKKENDYLWLNIDECSANKKSHESCSRYR